MCEEIEYVQKRASKIIFGWETDYNALVNEKKIESVEERRERLTLNFAQKTSNNPRFAHWFEKRQETVSSSEYLRGIFCQNGKNEEKPLILHEENAKCQIKRRDAIGVREFQQLPGQWEIAG